MNLLLLLSAMLSALTGAMTGTRAEAPRQVAAANVSVAIEAVAAPSAQIGTRPVAALPGLADVSAMPLTRISTAAQSLRLYASRRRE